MRKPHSPFVLPLIFAVGLASLGAAGCSGATSAASPAGGATQQAIVTDERGPLRAVGQAFAEVPLSSDQRTRIEALFRATEARHAEAWRASASARKELLLLLADQVQAGAIDKAALAPKLAAATGPWQAAREQDRAALVALHGTLTPEQRSAFVEAFRPEHMHRGPGGHGRDRAEQAHHQKGKHQHFGKILKELDLSADQKDKLKEVMRDELGKDNKRDMKERFMQRRSEGKKALEAFKTDRFTGEGVFPAAADKPGGPEARLEKMLRIIEAATPILTPEQRTKAAAALRERAQ